MNWMSEPNVVCIDCAYNEMLFTRKRKEILACCNSDGHEHHAKWNLQSEVQILAAPLIELYKVTTSCRTYASRPIYQIHRDSGNGGGQWEVGRDWGVGVKWCRILLWGKMGKVLEVEGGNSCTTVWMGVMLQTVSWNGYNGKFHVIYILYYLYVNY